MITEITEVLDGLDYTPTLDVEPAPGCFNLPGHHCYLFRYCYA